MMFIPKVKSVSGVAEVGTAMIQNRTCSPGDFTPGKLPSGFQGVWNFKQGQPNDFFTRKESPTSPGEKKRG